MADSNKPYAGRRTIVHYADLVACLLAVALSAWAYSALPGRDPLRIALVAPMLLFVPGYLLIEAFRTSREPLGRRVPVAAVAPGLSLAFVALLALLTAWLPSGFTPDATVAMVSLVCLGLVASASYRRARLVMTDWSTVPTPHDPAGLPRITPRAAAPPMAVPPEPQPTAPSPAVVAQSFQPIRPGTPVSPPSGGAVAQADTTRASATAQNAGADLRDQNKQPPRAYHRVVQTGRL